ncbi:FAD/NAD(P)-binding domain-containing protein [Xylona heveae TC161]|uniref:FAD/NAD(P)-binding domain-containing protein n=1 Tax=Xylona heveae (strain CBS 132557 / TC161) TaxID=1328760 RepID=A0A165HZH8_XYLHT|nr:FAD/NAD(P)-binding domain-containing protein [Xylona heveae TC161]KZF24139.1 FAD/NAD(P)-binding domain-containing protein [Xylona heveae TC161]
MECNTNGSRGRNSNGEGMSRIERDLSKSPHHPSTPSGVDTSDQPDMFSRRLVTQGRKPNVCIVGAGMAGLRCAEVLIKHGVKCTIFEGRERVGGRVHQSKQLGHLVDLGPNWIHGTDHNPILDLARETKTALHSWGERQSLFDEEGNLVDDQRATHYSEVVWSIIADAFKYSNEHSATIEPSESLMDFFKQKTREAVLERSADSKDSATLETLNQERETILRIAKMWGAFVGSSIERQSLKYFWLEECIEGENLFVAGTYQAILQLVAKVALAEADVQFGKTVISIETLSGPDGKARLVTVRTADGASQIFDEVVMTAPLGWLKKYKDAFSPALPPRLSEAIDSISYGTLEKVYVTFPSAFWEPSASKNATSQDKDGTSFPGFNQWIHPEYAASVNPDQWGQEAVNLAALPTTEAHPTMLFYIYGACSKYITTLVTSTPDAELEAALDAFFQPYYSKLPNYSAASPACKPKAFLATTWSNDELAGNGSYCNFQVGLTAGDADIEVMREGMPDRGVWLAGEHTAPFVALGTVTGAYWSGEGVARRILQRYNIADIDSHVPIEAKAKNKDQIPDAAQLHGLGL